MTLMTKPVFFPGVLKFSMFSIQSLTKTGDELHHSHCHAGTQTTTTIANADGLDLRHSRAGPLGAPSHDACRKRGENVCCFRLFSMFFCFFPKTCSYCSFLLQVGHVHSFFILGCICCNVQYMVWPVDGQPVAGVLSVEDPGYLLGKLEIQ